MKKNTIESVDKDKRRLQKKPYIGEKRQELVWALGLQGYSWEDIGLIFGLHRSSVLRIYAKKPSDWKSKWVKII